MQNCNHPHHVPDEVFDVQKTLGSLHVGAGGMTRPLPKEPYNIDKGFDFQSANSTCVHIYIYIYYILSARLHIVKTFNHM